MTRTLEDAVVLITGANGGLGTEFVGQVLHRGARKVYAATRRPSEWTDPRVVPLHLDVRDGETVLEAVRTAGDTTVVINNAGISRKASLLEGDIDAIQEDLAVNFWGQLAVARAFAPVLTANGGTAALVNVLSGASWNHRLASYSVSKAAMWAASNALRLDLAPQHVDVIGVHMWFIRTAMSERFHGKIPMLDPEVAVHEIYDQFEAGQDEILVDQETRDLKQMLAQPLGALYPELRSRITDVDA